MFPSTKTNAVLVIVFTVALILGARFVISDPTSGPLNFRTLFGNELRVPPCPFQTITGWPCPICGLTRSVAMTVRGYPLIDAFYTNALGPVVIGLAIIVSVYSAIFLVLPGSKTRFVPSAKFNRTVSLLFVATIIFAWVMNLFHHFQTLR
jgi:hypothetical protein